MTPKPNEKPEHMDLWLELDPAENQPETVRIEPSVPQPTVPEPAVDAPEGVPPPRRPLSFRDSWRTLLLLALGFAGLFGTFLYFNIQPDPEAKLKQGFAALEKNDASTAVAYFTEVIKLGPDHADGYYGRGQAYQLRGEYAIAIRDYSAAIRLNPRAAAAYFGRGCCYYRLHDHDGALADSNHALDINNKLAGAYHLRGNVYSDRKEYDRAISEYDAAIALDPNYAETYVARGMVHSERKNYDQAMLDYNRAIKLNSQSASAYLNRGHVWQKRGLYSPAVADFATSLRLDPRQERGGAQDALAWLLATCPDATVRDGKRAVELASMACEMTAWTDPWCLESLAAACAEAGEFAEAVKWQKKRLEHPQPDREGLEKAQERLKLYEQGKPYRDE